jgi:hypothetical protein
LRLFNDDGTINDAGNAYIEACQKWANGNEPVPTPPPTPPTPPTPAPPTPPPTPAPPTPPPTPSSTGCRECNVDECTQTSGCGSANPFVCTNGDARGGCSADPLTWVNTDSCSSCCNRASCSASTRGSPTLSDQGHCCFHSEECNAQGGWCDRAEWNCGQCGGSWKMPTRAGPELSDAPVITGTLLSFLLALAAW